MIFNYCSNWKFPFLAGSLMHNAPEKNISDVKVQGGRGAGMGGGGNGAPSPTPVN